MLPGIGCCGGAGRTTRRFWWNGASASRARCSETERPMGGSIERRVGGPSSTRHRKMPNRWQRACSPSLLVLNGRRFKVPILLDLFCGAGVGADGYADLGFTITGVDINPQPNYPYAFIQDDALQWLERIRLFRNFDVIHASPPCQTHTE